MIIREKHQHIIIVIGGGAAGMYCAVNAAAFHKNSRVILLEKTGNLLTKVKVSGGGRCNVTHACFEIPRMVKCYPRGSSFLKKAFHHHFTTDTINWFEQRGVKLKIEPDGRMFPETDNSQTIIDCLLAEAAKQKVEIRIKTSVSKIQKQDDGFELILQNDEKLFADKVCIACGGQNSKEKMAWISSLGHTVIDPVPSLFTFNLPKHPITKLMGVVVVNAEVKISSEKLITNGPILVTHWGLSGPAILKQSAWAALKLAERDYNFQAIINWVPNFNEQTMLQELLMLTKEKAVAKIVNKNPFLLPARLWEFLLDEAEVKPDTRYADLPAKNRNRLAKLVCNYTVDVQGKTGFKEEFVTAGGVDTAEINPNSMGSRKIAGLYFAGEILNVDGITGGYNFQNAWTTGYVAAMHLGPSVDL